MDNEYGYIKYPSNKSYISRMNPNHPFPRKGRIFHYSPDDSAYNSEGGQNDIDPCDSSESGHKYDKYNDTIQMLLERNEDSFPESDSKSNFIKNGPLDKETQSTHLTKTMETRKVIHFLDGNDEVSRILESRRCPLNLECDDFETDDNTVHIKTPTPIKTTVIEDEDEKVPEPPRMDWNDYHTLDVIHNFLDDLEYDYPSICTAGSIGKSLEGRDLKMIKISNSETTNSCVWIDAGIHAREWIAPAVATYIANHIVNNFDTLPTSVTNKDWYILPVVNPDGYVYSHTVDRMWRKNRALVRGQCVGVDLNRNFSFGWGGNGSSCMPNNAFYRGPAPFSEPESRAMRDMLVNSGISFKVYITLHSFGQVIIFPFAFKEDLCPDYVRLLEGATVMSKAIHEASGNTYKVGISRDIMYGAAGTSNDWSYGEAGIPFCYLIELRSRKHKFKLPQEEIEETGKEILNCVKALMEFVDKYPMDKLKM